MARNIPLPVRVTPLERAALKGEAQRRGMTVSDLVRQVLATLLTTPPAQTPKDPAA